MAIKKTLSTFIIVLIAIVLLSMFDVTYAQSAPKPSTPEFTVKFLDSSYTEITTNAYTGLEEIERITDASIEILITNQHYAHSDYQIYYNIRCRPHFEGNWTELSSPMDRPTAYKEDGFYRALFISDSAVPQSNSSYTILSFAIYPTRLYQGAGYDVALGERTLFSGIPYGSQLDFQVEAQVGHPSQTYVSGNSIIHTPATGYYKPAFAYDTSSGWSSTQTVKIGETSSLVSPSPTEIVPDSQTLPPSQNTGGLGVFGYDYWWLVVAVLVIVGVVVLLVFVVFYLRKRSL